MGRNDISTIQMTTGEWGKIRAYATIKFTNGLVVRGFKVIEGAKGLFIGMPSREAGKGDDRKWEDVCYFDEEDTGKAFSEVLLSRYQEQKNKAKDDSSQGEKGHDFEHKPQPKAQPKRGWGSSPEKDYIGGA